jgi:hypothetical protein
LEQGQDSQTGEVAWLSLLSLPLISDSDCDGNFRFCEFKRHIGSPVERDIHLDVVLRVRSIFRDIV